MKNVGMLTNEFSKERTQIDFSTLDSDFNFILGKVNYSKAHEPIENHIHKDMMEITLIVKGKQVYTVNDIDYAVNSNEVFITFANELHGSGVFPEDKSLFYYLHIGLDNKLKSFIGYNSKEACDLIDTLNNIKNRKFEGSQILKSSLEDMINAFYMSSRFKKTIIRNLITKFLIDIINCGNVSNSAIDAGMQLVLDFIHDEIYEDISVPILAGIAGLSVPRFKSKFRSTLGIPPHEYVLREKIETSKTLLKKSEISITEVAHNLSFSSSQHFSTVFKRFTYISPTKFRADAVYTCIK